MKRMKMKKITAFWVGFFILCFVTVGFSGINPTGGHDAPYFQAEYVQDLSEYSAALINPALTFRVNQMHAEFGMYTWDGFQVFDDEDLGYMMGNFLLPIRLRHTVGISVIGCGSEFEKTKIENGVIVDDGTGAFMELWFVPHYSFRILPWLSAGLNVKFVVQNQFGEARMGIGGDLGFYATVFDHYRFGDFGLSLSLQDFVPAKISWGVDTLNTPDQIMTTRFRGGARYAVMNNRLIFDFEAVVDKLFQAMWKSAMDLEVDDVDSYLDKVGRYSFHSKFEIIPQWWFKIGWANNNIPYVGSNINVIYLGPESINYLSFDLHFGLSINEMERGMTGMFKVSSSFGPTREQRESKRMYDKLVLAPMNAYNEAMRLYVAGKFWDASFAFGKVLSLFPNFHLTDRATYYMGNCYTELRLHDVARQTFKDALSEFTTSEVRADFLYGLQLIDFREGKYKDALKNHAFITNLYGESEVRSDADYIAGQTHFIRKNYSVASQILAGITPDAKTYNYAQYTLAVINIENNKINAAIQNLQSVVSDTSDDDAQNQLHNAADVKLGQLYFEQVELRKAVEAFKRVPDNSEQGHAALLGTAWSWIKVNRPQECLNAIGRLISSHSESPLIPEAYLIKGYSLMLLERDADARVALEECLRLCRDEFEDDDDLALQKDKYTKYASTFAPTEMTIKKNALRKPTDKIVSERVILETEYKKYEKESMDYFNFQLLVDNNNKFFRQKDQIIMDAEYALAKVSKTLGSAKEQGIIKKDVKKQEKIDDEIEKLQQELETLDEE